MQASSGGNVSLNGPKGSRSMTVCANQSGVDHICRCADGKHTLGRMKGVEAKKARFDAELIQGHKGVTVVLVPIDLEEKWSLKPTRLAGRRDGWTSADAIAKALEQSKVTTQPKFARSDAVDLRMISGSRSR